MEYTGQGKKARLDLASKFWDWDKLNIYL
jgi:hypothetical protein